MFTYQNAIMNRPLIYFLLSLLVASANGQAPQEEPQTPPPPMSMGKGKGKGKGRPMPPAQPVPAVPPAPNVPAATGPTGTQTAAADFFDQKILPVLQQKCFECHQSGKKMKGGLAVDSRAALIAGGDSGPALVPGDAAKSLLHVSMTYADPDLQMPPRERLSDAVLADFKKWIEMGAPFGASDTPPGITTAPGNGGFFATLTAVRGNSVTYTRDEAGGGGMMRGGMAKGKGKGAAMRGGGGSETTQQLADKALVTSATLARRTQDLLVGIELSGGLENPAFDAVGQGGAKVHLVVKDGEITELNLITAQDESDAPVAVKPKRPPSKPGTLTP